MIMNNKYK